MAALAKYRPEVATVLDFERPDQIDEVLSWANEAAQHVRAVVIVAKVPGTIDDMPAAVGSAQVRIGYSVPTSYGGTCVPLWEFGRRSVHLLGGSPQAQLRLRHYLNVVSIDGGMAQQQANWCRYWSRQPGRKGHWNQLGTDQRDGANLECFRRSLDAIRAAWESKS